MKLELMQSYYSRPPFCQQEGCLNRALRLWKTPDGKGLDLCGTHEPEITPVQVAEFTEWQDANWGTSLRQPRPLITGEPPVQEPSPVETRQESTVSHG